MALVERPHPLAATTATDERLHTLHGSSAKPIGAAKKCATLYIPRRSSTLAAQMRTAHLGRLRMRRSGARLGGPAQDQAI